MTVHIPCSLPRGRRCLVVIWATLAPLGARARASFVITATFEWSYRCLIVLPVYCPRLAIMSCGGELGCGVGAGLLLKAAQQYGCLLDASVKVGLDPTLSHSRKILTMHAQPIC